MASKSLLRSFIGKRLPATDAVNEAGGRAYANAAKHQLAQYAATGCLNQTFDKSSAEQLDTVLKLTEQVSPEFIAQTALYARQTGYLKDMPTSLCAAIFGQVTRLVGRSIRPSHRQRKDVTQLCTDHAFGSRWSQKPANSAQATDFAMAGIKVGQAVVCWFHGKRSFAGRRYQNGAPEIAVSFSKRAVRLHHWQSLQPRRVAGNCSAVQKV